jgi:hypothetical protein
MTATLTATRIVIVSTGWTNRTNVRDESYSKRPCWTLSDGSLRRLDLGLRRLLGGPGRPPVTETVIPR